MFGKQLKVKEIAKVIFSCCDRINGHFVDTSQTIVINGFWRSGTTWVQEVIGKAIGAKMIFEPLQARARPFKSKMHLKFPEEFDYKHLNGLMPCHSVGNFSFFQYFDLIDAAQKGILTDSYILRRQKLLDLGRMFNRKVVVKYVRGTLFLSSLARHYNCPVIHIYRDPRAVISSIFRNPNWGEGTFSSLDLKKQLLEVGDDRLEFFSQYSSEILRISKHSPIEQVTAYYCLTEKFLLNELSKYEHGNLSVMRYEDIVLTGFKNIVEKLNNFGFVVDLSTVQTYGAIPSSTQYYNSEGGSTSNKRTEAWRKFLDEKSEKLIVGVVKDLGMECRLRELS